MTIKTQHPKYVNKQTPDVSTPAPYNFDLKLSNGTHTIEIDTAACYGYWQNDTSGTEGGLWFEVSSISTPSDTGRKLELIDYDGVACLPMKVIKSLREGGLIVTEDFE